MKPYANIAETRSMTAAEIGEEFDLVYLDVEGILQPIPADKVQPIAEVFETWTVYADIGVHRPVFAEIEISLEDLRAGLSIAPCPKEDSFQEMEETLFRDWEPNKSFTDSICDYCGYRDCCC